VLSAIERNLHVDKLTSVVHSSLLLLKMNFVITTSGSTDYFGNVVTKQERRIKS